MLDIPGEYGGISQNIITFDRDGHRYVFVFSDRDLKILGRELGGLASDGDVNFQWRDARDVWEFAEDMVNRFGGGRF